MGDKEYLTSVGSFVLFGPARMKLLLNYFKSAKNIWFASRLDLLEVGLSEKIVGNFLDYRRNFNIEKYFKELDKNFIKVFTIFEKDYPYNLKMISDAPYCLYVRGEIKVDDNRSLAIVGSRTMTNYGKAVTQKFASELASFGITVVSGLALGVDAEAQRSALRAGGRTISVLASGLDIITPLSNKSLALEFIKNNGAVVSEYPLGHTPMPFEFPVRDRLISGMAKAVLVVEGKKQSGTFHTVQAAAEQGRPVFAIPGSIFSPTSEAPNYLIQNGAKLVTNIKDILDELDMEFKANFETVKHTYQLGNLEQKLVDILNPEPLHLDELARISGLQIEKISANLTIMEMKGIVKNLGQGVYKKN